MSIKKVVFEYLEKHPQKSIDQVVDGLSEFKKASVRKYYYDFKKIESVGRKEKKKAITTAQDKSAGGKQSNKEKLSVRQRIYDLLAENPDVTIDNLCQEIENSNRKTIRDYRNRWRKENQLTKSATTPGESSKDDKKSAKEKKAVYEFMKQYPEANLNDLRKLFPKYKKLVTDFRSWKRQQPKKNAPTHKVVNEVLNSQLPDKSDPKAVQSLKKTIEKQKTTIETQRSKLKEVRKQLAKTSKLSLEGLKSFLMNKIFKR